MRLYYDQNSHVVVVDEVLDYYDDPPSAITGATVTVDLLDEDDASLLGSPVSASEIDAPNNKYQAVLPSTVTVSVGQKIKAKVEIDAGGANRQGTAIVPLEVQDPSL